MSPRKTQAVPGALVNIPLRKMSPQKTWAVPGALVKLAGKCLGH